MIVTEETIQDIPQREPVFTWDVDCSGNRYKRFGFVLHAGPWPLIEHVDQHRVTNLAGFSKNPVFTYLLPADYKTRQKP